MADTALAVSEEILEIRNEAVRRFLSAFDGDREAFRETLHPEIEWYPIEKERRVDKGVDAATRNRDQWLETWDEHKLDVEEVVEDGDDVVALIHLIGRGGSSGVEVDVRFWAQFRVRDGKVAYIYDHEDRDAAIRAAGVGEYAMSQENVDLIKRQIEALNRGDWEASTEGVSPQVEWVVAREHPSSRTVRGLEELRVYQQDWRQMLGGLRFDCEEVIARESVVVAIGRIKGIGAGSGAEIEVPIGFVSRFCDGLVVKVEEYLDPSEALEAAGLSE